jgi:hypothetical protein
MCRDAQRPGPVLRSLQAELMLSAIPKIILYPRLKAGASMPHPSGWGHKSNFGTSSSQGR